MDKNFDTDSIVLGTAIACVSLLVSITPVHAETVEIDRLPNSNGTNADGLIQIADPLTAQNVTSVSQLSDVQPTDWAFTALQSLVERYGCIAGYPDRTFKGARSTTRYEFAAGLNACLDKINELISAGLADKVSKEDLAALQKLQEEFAAELALLRGRVDALEVKTARLEAQQFSTTTKLSGEAIFAITGGGSGNGSIYAANTNPSGLLGLPDRGALPPSLGVPFGTSFVAPPTGSVNRSSGNVNTTFDARVRLDFNTSFTGKDLLLTRLEAGSGNTFGIAPILTPATLQGNYGNVGLDTYGLEYSGFSSEFRLSKLRYDFNLGEDLRVSIGPVMHIYDHVDRNSYANNEAVDFSSTFFINNPLVVLLNPRAGGAGAALDWNPGKGAFSLRAVYIASSASSPDAGRTNPIAGPPLVANRGLFGNPYQGTIEVEYAPKNGDAKAPFAIRLEYTEAALGNRDGRSGGVNVEWAFAKNMAVFGRYGFGRFRLYSGEVAANPNLFTNVQSEPAAIIFNPQSFQAGLAFLDLFKSGSIAAIAVGQPYIENKVGNTTQTNLELFFNFPVSDNISITPDLQFIFNPNNNSFNSTITVATLRTVFRF